MSTPRTPHSQEYNPLNESQVINETPSLRDDPSSFLRFWRWRLPIAIILSGACSL